jgi:ribosomal protein S18 acetylase RimI-like enzyme
MMETISLKEPMAAAPIEVTPARADDARAIAEVHVRSWQHAYEGLLPEEFLATLSVEKREFWWRETLVRGSPQVLVARDDEGLCGFVCFGASRDEDAPPATAEIWAIYLLPRVWSRGVGQRLWRQALARLRADGARRVTLWALAGNARAIRFYRREGFTADEASRRSFELGGVAVDEIRYLRHIEAPVGESSAAGAPTSP